MKWLTDTIAGRTILVLLCGFGTVLFASHSVYEYAIERETRTVNTTRLAERLLFLKRVLLRLPQNERDSAALSLSGGAIEIHWSLRPLATSGGASAVSTKKLRSELLSRHPELGEHGLVVGISEDDPEARKEHRKAPHAHFVLISMQLEDKSWVNISQVTFTVSRYDSPSYWLSLLIFALGTVAISVLMARWLTKPLSRLTQASHQLFSSMEHLPVPEDGPKEVRELGEAINEMQERIDKLIKDRTQTLAAISHDLQTPLTRLRLRLENLEDEQFKTGALTDLDDMEGMIDATLGFLRGESLDEPTQTFDLVAVLDTITHELCDMGATASLSGNRKVIVKGRRLALKRAFTNILQNAVRYGNVARTSVIVRTGLAVVVVDDDGPGIPTSEQERVFSPFYRIESSRNMDTGGHGLGLTVAQTIVRAHSGDISLTNRAPYGLSVTLSLPLAID
ncbi:ATP-binding protein [Filomicrobium sp.]|uniref:ATP-binding protein n=1 Tax=Filomicrobium sp. TaxID=2024831 RepID=UPI00258CDCF1|nr:ATP-binding protein [Filomicrobium sp.]MCV0371785.1 HAMP domain-containing protein [Filomicrobium sp.]